MSRQHNISELKHAIIPSLRWSPVAWMVTMSSIVVSGICIILACRDNEAAMILLLFALPGTIFVICLFWLHYRCQHGFYVNGLLYRKFFRDFPILFADVESYSLIPTRKSSLRDKMMGKPDTYEYRMIFFLKEDRPLKKVTIDCPKNDDRVETFFAELRNAIFRRMYACYQNEKKFDWTPHVRVLEQGVEMLGDTKNASARDVFIPFCDLDKSRIDEIPTARTKCKKTLWQTIEILWLILQPVTSILFGTFQTDTEERMVLHLYRIGHNEPEIMIPCISPNFHPGYDTFRRIVWDNQGMDTNYTFAGWHIL